MIKTYKIAALLLFYPPLFTQTYSTQKQKLTIGVEYGFAFKTLSESDTYGYKQIYGLNFGIPVNQLTLEFGILRNDYGIGYVKDFTGNSEIKNGRTVYYYDQIEKHLDYFQLSNRIQYRLACNCVFFHVGFNVEFLRPNSYHEIQQMFGTYREPKESDSPLKIKSLNTGIDFGIGFKQHFLDSWKIFMRPALHLASPFSNDRNNFEKGFKTFRITLGIQKGI